ncbi:hemerythrin domain-containing protein [Sulfuricystis multivorans]|uniref:hemerythrin domain-containing protein n=1 Tax=Sulfuricystis multivorans TaxID=2211108 RepID=UPI000F81ED84|nr:hemerythrin domain-containing protein [Sulfuricystis multivorans]
MHNRALAILHDEHRSLGAVLHGLHFLVREAREKGKEPDFKLLWAMLYYMDAFSQRLHDPREEALLFARLRARTREADETLTLLERQHAESARHIQELERLLGQVEAGVPGSLDAFAAAVEAHLDAARQHMLLEEKVVIPLAKKYLTAQDWLEITDAFAGKDDQRFGPKPEHEFRDLFSRIVNLAPPPIGVGPTHTGSRRG